MLPASSPIRQSVQSGRRGVERCGGGSSDLVEGGRAIQSSDPAHRRSLDLAGRPAPKLPDEASAWVKAREKHDTRHQRGIAMADRRAAVHLQQAVPADGAALHPSLLKKRVRFSVDAQPGAPEEQQPSSTGRPSVDLPSRPSRLAHSSSAAEAQRSRFPDGGTAGFRSTGEVRAAPDTGCGLRASHSRLSSAYEAWAGARARQGSSVWCRACLCPGAAAPGGRFSRRSISISSPS